MIIQSTYFYYFYHSNYSLEQFIKYDIKSLRFMLKKYANYCKKSPEFEFIGLYLCITYDVMYVLINSIKFLCHELAQSNFTCIMRMLNEGHYNIEIEVSIKLCRRVSLCFVILQTVNYVFFRCIQCTEFIWVF